MLTTTPDGRVRHAAAPGFWVYRWLRIDNTLNYFQERVTPMRPAAVAWLLPPGQRA